MSLIRGDTHHAPVRPLVTRPTVSVVVPCYNYGHYLPVAVGSVLSQPGVDVEVIIVDDASPDGSGEVAQRLADDPRVSAVLHAVNRGHIATYNDGLERVTGDYVVLLSADDALAPGSLARAVALMEAHPDVGLVYGFAPDFQDEFPIGSREVRSWSIWHGRDWIRRICRRGTNIIVNPEAVVRASVAHQLAGYDADLPFGADMDYWMRAAMLGDVGRVNGPYQAFYRVHGSNMHLTAAQNVLLGDSQERAKLFGFFFERHSDQFPDPDRLHALASRATALEAVRTARLLDRQDPAASGLAGLAVEIFPGIVRTAAWRGYAGRNSGPARGPRTRGARLIHSMRWQYRWRRWRRYGT